MRDTYCTCRKLTHVLLCALIQLVSPSRDLLGCSTKVFDVGMQISEHWSACFDYGKAASCYAMHSCT